MNRDDLRASLNRDLIDARSYDLSGIGRPESYVLRERAGVWEVFYSERGRESRLHSFETEDEACGYFFDLVTGDPTTKLI